MGCCSSHEMDAEADAEAKWTAELPCHCSRQYSFTTSFESVVVPITTCCGCSEMDGKRDAVQLDLKCRGKILNSGSGSFAYSTGNIATLAQETREATFALQSAVQSRVTTYSHEFCASLATSCLLICKRPRVAIIKCDLCGLQFRRTYELRYHEKRKAKRWGYYGKRNGVTDQSADRFSFAHLEQCFALIEQQFLEPFGADKVHIKPNKNWANDFYQLVTAGEQKCACKM